MILHIIAKNLNNRCVFVFSTEKNDNDIEVTQEFYDAAKDGGAYIVDGEAKLIPKKPKDKNFFDVETEKWVFDQSIADDEFKASVPKAVTMRQARRAMIDAKIYEKVDAAIKSMGGKALVDWEYSNSFERNNPMLEQLGKSLGLTEKQIDELFIAAAKEFLP